MSVIIRKVIAILMIWLGFTQFAGAGIVLVSGDVNIANFIDGSYDFAITPGNASFLRNVLGSGTKVFIHNEGNDEFQTGVHEAGVINNIYKSIAGVTSKLELSANSITSDRLLGIDLYLEILPRNNYSPIELAAVNEFLAGSGKVFFIGDNNEALSEPNEFINQSLLDLDSSLRFGNDSIFANVNGRLAYRRSRRYSSSTSSRSYSSMLSAACVTVLVSKLIKLRRFGRRTSNSVTSRVALRSNK